MPAILENDALAMYVAAAVALVVMIGFFWYIWRLDREVTALRRSLNEQPAPQQQRVVEPLRPQRRVEQEQTDGNLGI